MNWNNLNKGTCPICEGLLIQDRTFLECEGKDFTIRLSKYQDIIKGKNSKAYQRKVRMVEQFKRFNEKNKKNNEKIKSIGSSERLFNLKKMLSKGEITQEEYNKKII